MPRPKRDPDPEKYEHDVLRELHVEVHGEKNKTVLRIVKWKNAPTPVLENRRMFFTKTLGDWAPQKVAGLGPKEWAILLENADEVTKLLSGEGSGQ